MFDGPDSALKPTNISQPAIVTMTIAAYEAFKKRSKTIPAFCAGLSLGEYSALIAAGSIDFKKGIELVRMRGDIMEEEASRHPGAMAAVIDLPIEKLSRYARHAALK